MTLVLYALFVYHLGVNIVSGQDLKKTLLINKKGDQLVSEEVLLGYMPQCENGTTNEEMEDRVKQLENEIVMMKRESIAKHSMENDRKPTLNANNGVAVFLNSAADSQLSQMQSLAYGKCNSVPMVFAACRIFINLIN